MENIIENIMDYPDPHRFRIFREHKHIFYFFSNILQELAVLDFNKLEAIEKIKNSIQNLCTLLVAHTLYEENKINKILIEKGSNLFQVATSQHEEQAENFVKILSDIELIYINVDKEERFYLGYKLYLDLRRIFAYVLNHLDYEETVIMPEMQRLLSDEEIKEIDHRIYNQMLESQILERILLLMPHLNFNDRMVFLIDIYQAEPDKFSRIWDEIKPALSSDEVNYIAKTFASE